MNTTRNEQCDGDAEGDERPRTSPPLAWALLRALHVLGSWSTNVVSERFRFIKDSHLSLERGKET